MCTVTSCVSTAPVFIHRLFTEVALQLKWLAPQWVAPQWVGDCCAFVSVQHAAKQACMTYGLLLHTVLGPCHEDYASAIGA